MSATATATTVFRVGQPPAETTPHPAVRLDETLSEHMPLVRYVAQRLAVSLTLPAGVDMDDLVSIGLFGLIEALERFDDERGVKFSTFAIPRIRGAILDGLRSMDWVPRNVRTRARWLVDAENTLTSRLGRAPTRDEVAELLGPDGLAQLERGGPPATLIALEELISGEGETVVADTLAAPAEGEPGFELEAAEMRERLTQALTEINERDRLVLTLYYFEQLSLQDVAALLNVTESRVSQLHRRALGTLREKLTLVDA